MKTTSNESEYLIVADLPDVKKEEVDGGKVVAKFENGVLRVHLPKGEVPSKQKIDIH